MALYLADTSIWSWSRRPERPDIAVKLAERVERGEVATCVPVILESMHRARSGGEYDRLYEDLFTPLDHLELSTQASIRALDVQRALAATTHGNHLRPAVDFLIAAVAELAGPEVTLWAFDRDLDVIAQHTGQPHEPEESTGPGH